MALQQHGFLILECLISIMLLASGVAIVSTLYWYDLQQQHDSSVRAKAVCVVCDLLEDCRASRTLPAYKHIVQGPITVQLDVHKDDSVKIPFSWIVATAQWYSLSGAACTYTVSTGMMHI